MLPELENPEPFKEVFSHCRTWREVFAVHTKIKESLRTERQAKLESGDLVEAAVLDRRLKALELHFVYYRMPVEKEDYKS